MLLFATLVLLAQAPAAAPPPPPAAVPALTLRVPALEAAGVPAHVVDFCQEHLYAELQRQGFAVLRADAGPDAQAAAAVRAVVVGELVLFPSGFRVTVRALSSTDGKQLAEHVAQGVPEQKLLDGLTEAVSALTPPLRAQLAPAPLPAAATAQADAATPALRRWAWAPAAGGALFLGTGTAFLLQARARQRELEAPGPGNPPLDGDSVARAGERAQTLSRVSFALGTAGVLTGAAFYFLPVQRLWGGGDGLKLQLTPGGVGVSGVLP